MTDMIIAFILSWLCALSGVALGGFLVFRTKREGYDHMFQAREQPGESFNLEDEFDFNMDQPKSKVEFPEEFQKSQDRFVNQFAESLAEKATK